MCPAYTIKKTGLRTPAFLTDIPVSLARSLLLRRFPDLTASSLINRSKSLKLPALSICLTALSKYVER
ncbi:MAG: hypothetical protein A2015_11000 [Spirochaetes bacterium GWF1_31_7]|nr:MAG: hypothetical protein A2Y30_13135 [Spirochaetes bacterium GWE1_32_154]OHD48385.1 MAG: hypothetical protein A2015_11000 [Spirochaetes bacterium GWF1_31_7]OHD50478.1 MAG: hypothetical protein A2Y29_11180 [Spirochaetes bacterium GWE2_31_10]HBD93237.1 hypothetical protein [Spirochaetia bacterium]HBI38369.1 hypothetical protein [Spirochaetia bacterium]